MANNKYNNNDDEFNEDEEYDSIEEDLLARKQNPDEIAPEHILLSIKYSIDNLKLLQKFCMMLYNGYIESNSKYEEANDLLSEKELQLKILNKEIRSLYSEIAVLKAQLETNNKENTDNEICGSKETI